MVYIAKELGFGMSTLRSARSMKAISIAFDILDVVSTNTLG